MISSVIILILLFSNVGAELLPISPFMFIGENLLLNCTIPESDKTRNLNISTAYFSKGDLLLPKENILISDDSALYNTTITSTNDEGRYGCWLETPNIELLGSQIVQVEYAPVAVTNLTCIVYDWTDGLRCDWSLGIDYVRKDFIEVKFWWVIPNGQYQPCPHLTNTSCTWNSAEYRGSSLMNIYIIVNNTRRNSNAYFSKELRTSQHVQPSAPTDLNVVGNVGKTCVTLNWGHEKSRPKFFSVTYELRNKTITEKEVIGSQNLTLSICDLTPYTLYNFIVKCKPKDKGYWSENRTIQITTLQDVPLSGPAVSTGSFKVTRCYRNKRTVVLYWADVAEDKQQGEIIEYMVPTPSLNFTVPNDVHTLELKDEPCDQTLTYNIYSKTIIGYSTDYSQIVIPPQTMILVNNFTIQMVVVNNTESIIGTWLPVKSLIDNTYITYTVYWCWYDPARPLCQDGINWKISNQSDLIVLPLNSKIWRTYSYGISVNIDNSNSGLQWTDCRITESAVPISPPEGIKVTEKENALEVRWKSEICVANSEALINQYAIKICPTKSCNDESQVQTRRVDSAKEQYLFKDLAAVNYSISLQAYSVAGAGPESSAVFAVPLGADTENRWTLKWIIITTVVSVVVFTLGCVCLCNRKSICTRKGYKIKNPINKSFSNQSPIYCGIDTNSPTHGLSTTLNIENGMVNGVNLNPNHLSSPTKQHLLKESVQNFDEILNEEQILTVDRQSNGAKLSSPKPAFFNTKIQEFVNPVFITSNGYHPYDTCEQLNTAISNNTRVCDTDLDNNIQTTNQVNNASSNISSYTHMTDFQNPDQDQGQGETKCADEQISSHTTLDELDHHGCKNIIATSSQENADHEVRSNPGVAEVDDYIQIGQIKNVLPSESSVIGRDHGVSSNPGVAEVEDYIQIGQLKNVLPSESSVIGRDHEVRSNHGVAEVDDYIQIGQLKNVLPSETSVIGSVPINVSHVKDVFNGDQCVSEIHPRVQQNIKKQKSNECHNSGLVNEPNASADKQINSLKHSAIITKPSLIIKEPSLSIKEPVGSDSVSSDSVGSSSSSEPSVSSYVTVDDLQSWR